MKRKSFLTVALLAAIALGGCTSGTEQIAESPEAIEQTNEAAGDSAPEGGVTAESSAAAGNIIESGGRSVKVVGISINDGLTLKNEFIEPIDGTVVVVDLELANTSTESGNFLFSQFVLEDSQGRSYEELTDMSYSMWRDEQGVGQRADDYFPGESRADLAAFRVAPDASGFSLLWKDKRIVLE